MLILRKELTIPELPYIEGVGPYEVIQELRPKYRSSVVEASSR